MGKMNELSQVIAELKECGQAMMNIAESLQEIFSAPAAEPVAETAAAREPEKTEAPAKTFTFIEVRKLLSEKSRAGHITEVKALLKKYGADKLSELAKESYAAVVAEAEMF